MKIQIPLPKISIYTDGSYRDRRHTGGWSAYIEYGYQHVILGDTVVNTTNNRMELTAMVEALRYLVRPCEITWYSDSQYALHSYSKWKDCASVGRIIPYTVINSDIITDLVIAAKWHQIDPHWVKGHASNPWNNLCDAHASSYSLR